MTDSKPVKKICEACKKEFSCAAESGNCWCFGIKLEAETLKDLRENYESCLCADCLKPKEIAD